MSQPLGTAQPRLEQRALCRPAAPTIGCRNTRSLFIPPLPSGNTLYQAFVYVSQRLMRMTHQKNSTIYPYVGVAADYTVWSPLGDTRREFLILFETYMKHV